MELTYATAIAIGVVTGTQALIDKAEEQEGRMINMCQAVTEALEESKAKGIQETRIELIQKMMMKLKMEMDEVMDILDIPLDEQKVLQSMITG